MLTGPAGAAGSGARASWAGTLAGAHPTRPGRRALVRLAALLLAACAARSMAPAAWAQPPGQLTVLLEAAPATLDPVYAADAYGVRISSQLLFETLVRLGDDLTVKPGLARSWRKLSPTRYRFELQPGVKFQDGSVLRADDVAYTLASLMDPRTGSPYGGLLREKVKAVRVLAPLAVELDLQAPFASILTDLVLPIRSRHAGKDQPLLGSGPYRLVTQAPNEIVLERFAGYHGPPPGVERIVFKVVQDENTRLLKFYKGDIDLEINALPLDKLAAFQRPPLNREYQVLEAPGLSYEYLGFNLQDPILSKRLVRQAIAHAINVGALITYRQKGHAVAATGIMAPGSPFDFGGQPPTYDPAQAAALLDQAGYPLHDGQRFALVYKTSTDRSGIARARIIQGDLRKVGIAVDVRSYEWATFYDDIQKGNFQLYSLRWIGVSDPDIQYELFHSSRVPPLGKNRGHYSNPRLDRLLEAGRLEQNPARRKEIYRQVNVILQEDLPYLSLWHNDNIAIVSRRWTGFRLHPTGGFQSLPLMRPAAP